MDLVYFTTQVPDTSDMSATRTTQTTQVQQEWDTSATRTTPVRHECYTNDTSATWVKKFYFNSDTSENVFSHSSISYMANERLKGEEQFYSKNYLSEMPCSHVKMRLKSVPQKLNFVMAKAIS